MVKWFYIGAATITDRPDNIAGRNVELHPSTHTNCVIHSSSYNMERTVTWRQKTAVVLKNKNINILHYKIPSCLEEACVSSKQRRLNDKKKTSALSSLWTEEWSAFGCASASSQCPCMTNCCVQSLTQCSSRIIPVESCAAPLHCLTLWPLLPQLRVTELHCGEAGPECLIRGFLAARVQISCYCNMKLTIYFTRKHKAVVMWRLSCYLGGIAWRQQKRG